MTLLLLIFLLWMAIYSHAFHTCHPSPSIRKQLNMFHRTFGFDQPFHNPAILSKNEFQLSRTYISSSGIKKEMIHRRFSQLFLLPVVKFEKIIQLCGRLHSSASINTPWIRLLSIMLLPLIIQKRLHVSASEIISTASSESGPANPIQGMLLWMGLFGLSAVLHSAESALTKLSIWQIQALAERQGPRSPFASLQDRLTNHLIAILLTTTACSIYSTALYVACMTQLFPSVSLGLVTASLTLLTLFFGEVLPKAVAVRNTEIVAQTLLPIVTRLSSLLWPVSRAFSWMSESVLQGLGVSRGSDEEIVSEDMLRRVVDEAQRSSQGIEQGEGRMIKGVLDMQDTEVGRVMRHRVDVLALPQIASLSDIIDVAVDSRYSRIPVYGRDIDHIVGVIFTKDLLQHLNNMKESSSTTPDKHMQQLTATQLMQPAFFIPETMSCWDALQEMKRRRSHMFIVVDEYGGTAGLVTFEDILEEVVGEIYDEDDGQEAQTDDSAILRTETPLSENYNSSAMHHDEVDTQHFAEDNSEIRNEPLHYFNDSGDVETQMSQNTSDLHPTGDNDNDNMPMQQGDTSMPTGGSNKILNSFRQSIAQKKWLQTAAKNIAVPVTTVSRRYKFSNCKNNKNVDGRDSIIDNHSKKSLGGFRMKAAADLDDVCEALNITLDPSLPECATLGGLLCAVTGRILQEGETVDLQGFRFTVLSVQDNRRLIDVLVAPLSSDDTTDQLSHNHSLQ